MTDYEVTGHRGAKGVAPENTLAGFTAAAEAGASWIEIDTQLSADLVPVIFHDKTVTRCTNGRGVVSKLTLKQLKELDAGSWFDSRFSSERIPTLAEALSKCVELDLYLNLEIKVHKGENVKQLVENVISVIRLQTFPVDKLLLSSFSLDALIWCQTLMPEVRRGYICEHKSKDIISECASISPYSIHMKHNMLTEILAAEIKNAGLALHIWTLNPPEEANKYQSMGVNNIITDFPSSYLKAN